MENNQGQHQDEELHNPCQDKELQKLEDKELQKLEDKDEVQPSLKSGGQPRFEVDGVLGLEGSETPRVKIEKESPTEDAGSKICNDLEVRNDLSNMRALGNQNSDLDSELAKFQAEIQELEQKDEVNTSFETEEPPRVEVGGGLSLEGSETPRVKIEKESPTEDAGSKICNNLEVRNDIISNTKVHGNQNSDLDSELARFEAELQEMEHKDEVGPSVESKEPPRVEVDGMLSLEGSETPRIKIEKESPTEDAGSKICNDLEVRNAIKSNKRAHENQNSDMDSEVDSSPRTKQKTTMNDSPHEENYSALLWMMLKKRVEPGESLEKYYYEKLELLNICEITGKRAVDCILRGVKDVSVRIPGECAEYKEPEQVLSYFRRLRPNSNMATRPVEHNIKGKQKISRCFKCNEVGHYKFNCPKTKEVGNYKFYSTKTKVICGICEKIGHRASQCFKNRSLATEVINEDQIENNTDTDYNG